MKAYLDDQELEEIKTAVDEYLHSREPEDFEDGDYPEDEISVWQNRIERLLKKLEDLQTELGDLVVIEVDELARDMYNEDPEKNYRLYLEKLFVELTDDYHDRVRLLEVVECSAANLRRQINRETWEMIQSQTGGGR